MSLSCFNYQEMLVEGTQVLGLGRLVVKDESLHLESTSSLPYVITSGDKNSMIKSWATPLPVIKFLTIIFVGASSFYAYRYVS